MPHKWSDLPVVCHDILRFRHALSAARTCSCSQLIKRRCRIYAGWFEKGLLSHKRLDEAVTRILALKASIGLHQGNPVPGREALACLQSREHQAAAERIADQSITLVKNKENLLPLTPRKTPKIKLIQITNERLPESGILEEVELFKELLEKEGFEVSYFKDGKYPDVDFHWKIIRKKPIW